jgi:hypothetical protein
MTTIRPLFSLGTSLVISGVSGILTIGRGKEIPGLGIKN